MAIIKYQYVSLVRPPPCPQIEGFLGHIIYLQMYYRDGYTLQTTWNVSNMSLIWSLSITFLQMLLPLARLHFPGMVYY